MDFETVLKLAESLPETDINVSGIRGYARSVWYADDNAEYVVDYECDGEPDRIQLCGTDHMWYAEEIL